jgi:hypothetical protein
VTLNSPQQLNSHLAFWIGCYYNRDCRHSTIDYLSLVDYVQQFITPPHTSAREALITVHWIGVSPLGSKWRLPRGFVFGGEAGLPVRLATSSKKSEVPIGVVLNTRAHGRVNT